MHKFENKTAPIIECVCKHGIPLNNILVHSQGCANFKAMFGPLSDSVIKTIEGTNDSKDLKVLHAIFTNAKTLCKDKIKSPSKTNVHNPVPAGPLYPQKY